ncbi:alpha-1,2-fucosyltransferase [Prevotella sp. 10(H)]|uniref:alpha-1,2-fucosyltransferase n=1 Tax=Prevotella sp. 10(H) TaxID=1158294 RepID=UPI0004A6EB9B|nr:alpha-1,2-fucosyltransferase [Prevotella sp. 10(H)]
MIVNYDSPGQLCNRIWSLLPSIAYGLEYKEKVLVINFDEYSEPFENLNINKYIKFASRKLFKRLLMSMKARGQIQNGKPNLFSKLFKLNLIEGWSNRLGNVELVIKQSDEIRKIFTFRSEIVNPVDNVFASLNNQIVIGVHIRRGDYDVWNNGIFYYSDEEYLSVMKKLEKQFSDKGQKVKFLLCSNENLNLNNFNELDCFIIPDSSGPKDLYALSKCSYIIGPPSSYSQWASYCGKVPVKFIMNAEEDMNADSFSKIVALNKFENEKVINID